MTAEDIRRPEKQPIVFKRRSDKIYKIKRQSKDPSWEGSLKKERSFQTPGNTLTGGGAVASLGISEGNITGKKNK